MVQSIELVLDSATDHRVREEWSALIDAGLPSAGRHTGPTNRPHLTVTVAREVSAAQELELIGQVAGLPMTVRLGGTLVFGPDPFVVARLVIPTLQLLSLQSRMAGVLDDRTVPHIRPGDWTPHVTLARRVSAADIGAVLTLVGRAPEVAGSAVAVRRWDSDRRRDWLIG